MAKRVGVLLSGCGVFDGCEIHEAVLTLLALDRKGAEIVCTAPDMNQLHVVNHLTTEEMNETRNVLIESARIARGKIVDLKNLSAREIDALIIPGGFGAAKNLSNFAVKGPQADVHPQVQRILDEMISSGKPIGAICIAPATLTRALSQYGPEVTIGTEVGTSAAIQSMGGKHFMCQVDQIHVDSRYKIVTTPAYMLGQRISEVATGIEKLVDQVLKMT